MDYDTSFAIHGVMVNRGFWSRPCKPFVGITNGQLCHVLIEWNEYQSASGSEKTREEAADVWIVINDLLGAHGFRVVWDEVEAKDRCDVTGCLADTMDTWRKHGVLPSVRLMDILGHLKWIEGDALKVAIEAKMRRNARRPYLYGVAAEVAAAEVAAAGTGAGTGAGAGAAAGR